MTHRERHIALLETAVVNRFDNLLHLLHQPIINGADIRLTVDNLKVILAEIRRLK